MELEIEDVVVSSLVRKKEPLSGAANASAVVEPIADFPKITKGVAGAGHEPCLKISTRVTKNQK